MAAPTIDPATAQAAAGDAELNSRKLALEGLRKTLAKGPGQEKKLKEACSGFEAIFLNKIWSQMRATVPKEGYLHSKEEDAYLSMFDQELMKKMSEAGGIGLGKMLYGNLSDHLSKASAGTAVRAAGAAKVQPLHAAAKGLPLQPEAEPLPLRSGDRRDAADPGLALAPGDAAKVKPQGADEAPAAPGVILPPGFRGPDPEPPRGPEDLEALARALDLARRVEDTLAAGRGAKAYRDAARDEAAVTPGLASPSLLGLAGTADGEEEPDS